MTNDRKLFSRRRVALRTAGAAVGFVVALAWGQAVFVDGSKAQARTAPATVSRPTQATAGGFTLRSVDIALPDEAASFPEGPGADLMTVYCTACHSPSMVLTQPSLSPAQWTATVTKMRDVYKAIVPDEAVPGIVGYLTSQKADGR